MDKNVKSMQPGKEKHWVGKLFYLNVKYVLLNQRKSMQGISTWMDMIKKIVL